jgi:hypothetical protein
MDQPENFELDVRIRDRLLKVGRIDRQGVEQHLSKLPDLSDRADLVTIAQPALAAETRAAAEPPIALALASEATVRHIEAPPRPVVVETPEEVEDEGEDEDEEPSEPVGQPAPAAAAKPEAAAFGGPPRQAPAIPAVSPAEQKPSFVAAPPPPPPEPPAPEPLRQTLPEAVTLRDPLAAPPPPAAEPAAVERASEPVGEPARSAAPAIEPMEAAPETPATSPLRSEPVASTEPAPAAETAAAVPPQESAPPSSAKPVSVPASSGAASDGTTEVADEGWDVPEEPGGNA